MLLPLKKETKEKGEKKEEKKKGKKLSICPYLVKIRERSHIGNEDFLLG
jgi:hypothetical protein